MLTVSSGSSCWQTLTAAPAMVCNLTKNHCLDVKHGPSDQHERRGRWERRRFRYGPRSKCGCLATYGSRRASIVGAWLKIDPASQLAKPRLLISLHSSLRLIPSPVPLSSGWSVTRSGLLSSPGCLLAAPPAAARSVLRGQNVKPSGMTSAGGAVLLRPPHAEATVPGSCKYSASHKRYITVSKCAI